MRRFHSNLTILKNQWKFLDFANLDYIIHCAAATNVREGTLENYEKYFGLNVFATKKLATKALDENLRHFIHLSTGQVFALTKAMAFKWTFMWNAYYAQAESGAVGTLTKQTKLQNDLYISAGMTFFFPEATYR